MKAEKYGSGFTTLLKTVCNLWNIGEGAEAPASAAGLENLKFGPDCGLSHAVQACAAKEDRLKMTAFEKNLDIPKTLSQIIFSGFSHFL